MQRQQYSLPEANSHKVVFNNGSGIVGIVGIRTGYVVVPQGHPWHSSVSEDNSGDFPEVHGGITWSGKLPTYIHDELILEDYYSIGWDYNHFANSLQQQLGISFGIMPTFKIISDEVVMVCQSALDLSNNS